MKAFNKKRKPKHSRKCHYKELYRFLEMLHGMGIGKQFKD